MGPKRKPLLDRFREGYKVDPSGCWLWQKYKNIYGYGMLCEGGRNGRMLWAHRVSYEFHCGPIGAGLEIDHLCRIRACVNPAHLEPVTHRTNILRGEAPSANCARQASCIRGHPFDERNTGRNKNGGRYCRACARDKRREFRARNRERYNAYMVARYHAKKASASHGAQ